MAKELTLAKDVYPDRNQVRAKLPIKQVLPRSQVLEQERPQSVRFVKGLRPQRGIIRLGVGIFHGPNCPGEAEAFTFARDFPAVFGHFQVRLLIHCTRTTFLFQPR